MDSKGKQLILRCRMRSSIRGGGKILGLDPYPLGERQWMDFPRKSIDCEVSDEVWHSRWRSVWRFRSTPLGARMYGFFKETKRCEVSDEVRHSWRMNVLKLRTAPMKRARTYGHP